MIKKGMDVSVVARERSGRTFTGKVMGTTNYLDPNNRSLLTEIKVPNEDGALLPGISRQRYLADLDRRLAHIHYLSPDEWRALCERHALHVDSVEGYLSKAEAQRWETLSRLTGGLLHSLTLGRSRPIEIQRILKLRSLQNRTALPRPIASGIARLIRSGVGDAAGGPSCLLLSGSKPQSH